MKKIYNIVDKWNIITIGIKPERNIKAWEWYNFFAFKKDIRKEYYDEFEDIKNLIPYTWKYDKNSTWEDIETSSKF